MTDPNVEKDLQSLLCGDLDDNQRTDLLARAATDEETRKLLKEMVLLQQHSRRLFGLDRGGEHVRQAVAELQHAIGPGGRPLAPGAQWRRAGVGIILPVLAWVARASVAAVVVISVCLAVHYQRTASQSQGSIAEIRQQLAEIRRSVDSPRFAPANLDNYKLLWSQMQEGEGSPQLWIAMQDGRGQFGYLDSSQVADAGLVQLVRCFLVDEQLRTVQSIDLLIPAGQDVDVSVSQIGQIAGRPVDIQLITEGQRTSLILSINTASGEVVALRGLAVASEQPVELGRIRLNGQTLRVMVHTLTIDTTA